MFILDTTTNKVWRRGKKTQGLRSKPLVSLIVDKSVVNKFLIDTLEGREPIDSANMFCIGDAGDAWQQTAKALLKKYDIKNIDSDGWMICEPKPENEVEFFQWIPDPIPFGYTYIKGQWGATIEDVFNLQKIVAGDFVCRQPDNHDDQWVVQCRLFRNTYTELGV
jgi:hypothetical protein